MQLPPLKITQEGAWFSLFRAQNLYANVVFPFQVALFDAATRCYFCPAEVEVYKSRM